MIAMMVVMLVLVLYIQPGHMGGHDSHAQPSPPPAKEAQHERGSHQP